MSWRYTIDVYDGLGKLHKIRGEVHLDGPPSDAFDYALRTSMQKVMGSGEYCPGPFKFARIVLDRVND